MRSGCCRTASWRGSAFRDRFTAKGIGGATLIPGVDAFLRRCRTEGCAVSIVSHKTEYGHYDPDRVNLRDAARELDGGERLVASEFGIPLVERIF